jgi:hypothetical protein
MNHKEIENWALFVIVFSIFGLVRIADLIWGFLAAYDPLPLLALFDDDEDEDQHPWNPQTTFQYRIKG